MKLWQRRDYKEVIRDFLNKNQAVWGYQKLMAEACGCQSAFISQVIHSHVHLTPDQAAALAQMWGLTELETDYFVNLVLLARATQPAFRKYISKKITQLRQQQGDPSRIRKGRPLNDEAQMQYHSHWYYAAVHSLVTIPAYRHSDCIAAKLALPEPLVVKVLHDLQQMGLIKEVKGQWRAGEINIHVGRTSPVAWISHIHWRHQAITHMQKDDPEALHYSSIYTVSKENYETIKGMLLDVIKKMSVIVEDSPDEELCCLNIDSFVI